VGRASSPGRGETAAKSSVKGDRNDHSGTRNTNDPIVGELDMKLKSWSFPFSEVERAKSFYAGLGGDSDLNEAIRDVIGLLATDWQCGRIAFLEELSKPLPLIVGDRVQSQQVIMNLLRNSIDAMTEIAQPERQILIRTALGYAETQVIIQDRGSCLETADPERPFDDFHTTKPNGMGIGLSVSRSIIEAHGGRIWAEFNPSGGANFGFSLPIDRERSNEGPVAEPNS
jgi:signal transduction histidine kinase